MTPEQTINRGYRTGVQIGQRGITQETLYVLGNGENVESGADIIKKGWNDNKWPQPVLSKRVQPNESILTLSVGEIVDF